MNQILWIVIILATLTANCTIPAAAQTEKDYYLSPNISINSYIYPYLDKLDGLGLLQPMQTGTKPYTRMQVAQWLKQLRTTAPQKDLPDYAGQLLNQLEAEFRNELAILDGAVNANRIEVTDFTWTNSYYDGPTLSQHRTESTYQPLYINQNGVRLDEGFNTELKLGVNAQIGEELIFSALPKLGPDSEGDFAGQLESGYLKTHLGNLQIQLGKDSLWWGQGKRANLLLTNNSEPLPSLKLSNIEPIKLDGWFRLLNQVNANFYLTTPDTKRTDVPDPSQMGFRMDFQPTTNFTFGAAFNSIIGGEGHEIGWDDLLDFFKQHNATSAADEKWNSIAGFDFRWRIPRLNGLQIYGEWYGEDQQNSIPPLPYRTGCVAGAYFPRLTSDGAWDLQLEGARTSNWWYMHWLYKDGYTYDGSIIGDAMGYNAYRGYAKVTRYLANGSQLAFHGEHIVMDRDAANPQTVNSFWTTYDMKLPIDPWRLKATFGLARIDNLDYQADKTGENYLGSIELNYRF